MGFRTGVLIGVLATAVVALGVAVLILASGGSDDPEPSSDVLAEEHCLLHLTSTDTFEFNLKSGVSCGEARGVYAAYQRSGKDDVYERFVAVEDWECMSYPLAGFPLRSRCQRGDDEFELLATDPYPKQTPYSELPGADSADDQQEPVTFQTPSGNIGCRVATTSVRCDIFERDWSPPPKPAGCEFPGWGHSIELESSGSTFLCSNDAVISPGGESGFPILHYGEAVAVGPFACESRENALVCLAKSSHGFRLSVQEVKLF